MRQELKKRGISHPPEEHGVPVALPLFPQEGEAGRRDPLAHLVGTGGKDAGNSQKPILFENTDIITSGGAQLIALGIPVFYFVFVRILLAGIILFLFNTAYGRIKRIQKKDMPKFLLLAFFEPFIYFICETYGLKETGSPTISAMIIATIPIFSIAAGILFFKEKINIINKATDNSYSCNII